MEIARTEQLFNNASSSGVGAKEEAAGGQDLETWELVLIIIGAILGLIILMYLIRRFIQGGQYTKTNRIDGKVVIITGCNTGIGKETAKELAKRGGKIYMACRDPKLCEDARLEIIEKTQNTNIFNRTLDLSSMESIRKFAAKFKEEEPRLDILINNAGVMACPKSLTKDGFELQLGVNHMGHFLLTNLLLDRLKESAPSRIVVLSSMAYMTGKINKDDLNSEKSYTKVGAYSQSKLANVLFTRYLGKKLEGTDVMVNCCHPGVVKTELSRHLVSGAWKKIASPITSCLFKTAKSGAQTSIKLAIDPDLKTSGCYYSDCRKFPLLKRGKNDEVAEWLWKTSEEWTGLAPTNENKTTTVEININNEGKENEKTK